MTDSSLRGIGGAGGKDKDLSSSIGANAKELQGANELVERRQKPSSNSAWVKVEGTWEYDSFHLEYGAVKSFRARHGDFTVRPSWRFENPRNSSRRCSTSAKSVSGSVSHRRH